MLRRLFASRNRSVEASCDALYGQIGAAARQPVLFADWDVPDTPMGRFEMMALFTILTLRRLSGGGEGPESTARALADLFFRETDRALRDLGVGDGRVPRQLRDLAGMFYGRAKSYGDAIGARDAEAFAGALARNVRPQTPDWPQAPALGAYAFDVADALDAATPDDVAAGRFVFPPADAQG